MEQISRYGLIGYPLSHSFSPAYFAEKFKLENVSNCSYEAFPIARIEDLTGLVADKNLKGFNVTIPYKQAVIPFLDQLDEAATGIGAVNTVRITPAGLQGYNTDAGGFELSLREVDPKFLSGAMVLGTGGSSKAIVYVLEKRGIPFIQVSRTPGPKTVSYQAISREDLFEFRLVINCTPLGMFPDVNSFPELPYEFSGAHNLFYDLVYNPETSHFLSLAAARGAQTKNGLEMLHGQANLAWEIWNS